MVFAAGDYTTHAARNLRWMCECLMPMYGGSVNPQRTVWTLPNGAVLSLAYIEQDDLSDYEGQSLSMVIVLNAHQWQPEVIEILTGYLRPTAGVPTRYVTTGEIQR